MIGKSFLPLAGHLVANTALGDPEARFRTAVSRAYYGAYHVAVEVLGLGLRVPKNFAGHEIVCRELRQTNHPSAGLAADLIGDLRTERNKADYDLAEAKFKTQSNAKLSVETAHEAVAALEACLLEPLRSTLVAHFSTRPKTR